MQYTPANVKQFDQYIESLDLKYFAPYEIRVHCEHKLNGLPPKVYWKNVASTLLTLDVIRREVKAPIFLSSVYRSSAYNKRIGGAKNSNHMYFCACDFRIQGIKISASVRITIDREIKELLKDKAITMAGRGYYAGAFIHLDTNHQNGGRVLGKLVAWSG